MSSTPSLAGTLVSAAVTLVGVSVPVVAGWNSKRSARAAIERDIELVQFVEDPDARQVLEESIAARVTDLAKRETAAIGTRDELTAAYFFVGTILIGFACWAAAATIHGWIAHPLSLIGTILIAVPLGIFIAIGVVLAIRTDAVGAFFRWATPHLPAEWAARTWRTIKATVSGWFAAVRDFVGRKTHGSGTDQPAQAQGPK